MQYPVPQFTDVEDRIIGGLSFKQFGIVFGAGVLTFAVYTISGKNIFATVIGGVFLVLPAIALAFGKLNGRPLYMSAGAFLRFLIGPKLYVFHKQVYQNLETDAPVEVHEEEHKKDAKNASVKIKELSYLLQQQASEEATLVARIQENKVPK